MWTELALKSVQPSSRSEKNSLIKLESWHFVQKKGESRYIYIFPNNEYIYKSKLIKEQHGQNELTDHLVLKGHHFDGKFFQPFANHQYLS